MYKIDQLIKWWDDHNTRKEYVLKEIRVYYIKYVEKEDWNEKYKNFL